MAQGGINIGAIYADLDVNSNNIPRGLAVGEKAIDAFKSRILELDRMLRAGAIGGPQHAAQVAELGRAITDMAARMLAANGAVAGTKSALDLLNAKLAAGANGFGGMNRAASQLSIGLMQVGYMFDDLQYGISAVVNNISPLAHGIAGAFGLAGPQAAAIAGGAQLAAVALSQLSRHWNELREALGDTGPMEDAGRSLDGLSARLKKLQADAEGFSWGENLQRGAGVLVGLEYDPDAGKEQKAALLKREVKDQKRNQKVADHINEGETDEDKKERERLQEAVVEFNAKAKARGGKTADVVIAERDMADAETTGGGAGDFLKKDKGSLRGVLGDKAVDLGLGALGAGMAGPQGHAGKAAAMALGLDQGSQKDTYDQLRAKEKSGQALSDAEMTLKKRLEEIAKEEAVRLANLKIGDAAFDRNARDKVAAVIGGEGGEVIAGRKRTDKDQKKIEEDWDKEALAQQKADDQEEKHEAAEGRKDRAARDAAWKAEATEREKQVKDAAEKAVPDLKDRADRLKLRQERERGSEMVGPPEPPPPIERHQVDKLADEIQGFEPDVSREEARQRARKQLEKERWARIDAEEAAKAKKVDPVQTLKKKILERTPGISDEEAEGVARDQMARTEKEDPEHRADRVKAANAREVQKLDPNANRDAEAAVAMSFGTGQDFAGAFGKGLKERLMKDRGMDEDAADEAVRGVLGEARQKVGDRLTNLWDGAAGERPEGKPPSRSEVYATGDLTSRIQGAISDRPEDKEAKKTNSLLEKTYEVLNKIADKKTVEFTVK